MPIENFITNDNKLLIKRTQNYEKVFSNSKYTIWIPIPNNDYYPIGNYISFDKKPPKDLAILVKNNLGEKSKDKPIKYEIVSITNKNFAIWKPIPNKDYLSLGNIYSKKYPSKYLIRTIPKKMCELSNIKNKIISNKVSSNDKGYELWSIQNSDLFICNNLNNYNIDYIKNVYKLKSNYLTIEKKCYIKNTNSYKKIASYKDSKLNKTFFIWRPIPPNNFCNLGDLCLNTDIDPNKKLDSIVIHKSFCKIPLNYGTEPIFKLKDENKQNISFWRPKADKDYYFFSDIVVIGDDQPEADNLIYSVSIDYIKENLNKTNMIYNNISDKDPFSIWVNKNHYLNINTSYIEPKKYILNKNFTTSDNDLTDLRTLIHIRYKKSNNFSKISNEALLNLIKKNISNKIDIKLNRLNDISINNNEVTLNIEQRRLGSKEPSINQYVKSLNKIIDLEPLKIYNQQKDTYYITLTKLYVKHESEIIELDNSQFNNKIK